MKKVSEIEKWRPVADKNNIPYGTYRSRIYKQKMTPESAATTPRLSNSGRKRKTPEELDVEIVEEVRTASEVESSITAMYKAGLILSPKQMTYLKENPNFTESLKQYNEERKKNMYNDIYNQTKPIVKKESRPTFGYYVMPDKIRDMIKKEGISFNEFSRRVGMRPSQFSNVLRLKMSVPDKVVDNICKYFDLKTEDLFVFAKKGEQHKKIKKEKK